jgi:adenylyltransferase/sulfurtransferase
MMPSAPAAPTRTNRYQRQTLLAVLGEEGQRCLAESRVLLVGCGALGSAIADQLVRAGVGELVLADRDYVELHNLQRQSLYDERDVEEHLPKAAAAARRLAEVNSEVTLSPRIVEVSAANIEELAASCDLIVDGTDNFETRYLLNEASVKLGIPWVYGGVIGTYGMTATFVPGTTGCLRCLFPDAPEPGSAPTCDTAGVLGPAVHAVASLQAAEALKIASGNVEAANRALVSLDVWSMTFSTLKRGPARADCPTCGQRRFELLDRAAPATETVLCGHDAVQVLVHPAPRLDLAALADRLRPAGEVLVNRFLLRFTDAGSETELTVFPDGRAIVKGTTDPVRARTLYDRFVGK